MDWICRGFRRIFHPSLPTTAISFHQRLFKRSEPHLVRQMELSSYTPQAQQGATDASQDAPTSAPPRRDSLTSEERPEGRLKRDSSANSMQGSSGSPAHLSEQQVPAVSLLLDELGAALSQQQRAAQQPSGAAGRLGPALGSPPSGAIPDAQAQPPSQLLTELSTLLSQQRGSMPLGTPAPAPQLNPPFAQNVLGLHQRAAAVAPQAPVAHSATDSTPQSLEELLQQATAVASTPQAPVAAPATDSSPQSVQELLGLLQQWLERETRRNEAMTANVAAQRAVSQVQHQSPPMDQNQLASALLQSLLPMQTQAAMQHPPSQVPNVFQQPAVAQEEARQDQDNQRAMLHLLLELSRGQTNSQAQQLPPPSPPGAVVSVRQQQPARSAASLNRQAAVHQQQQQQGNPQLPFPWNLLDPSQLRNFGGGSS